MSQSYLAHSLVSSKSLQYYAQVANSDRGVVIRKGSLPKNIGERCKLGKYSLQSQFGSRVDFCSRRFLHILKVNSSKKISNVITAQAADVDQKLKAAGKEVNEMLQGSSLYLVGMMGSGKSSMSGVLSSALQYAGFDSDQVVEQLTQKNVQELFEEVGEEEFRDTERQVIRELCAYKNCVVSTGGGVAQDRINWMHMRNGVVVFLDVPPETLARRMLEDGSAAKRPLLAQAAGGQESLASHLSEILEERREMYEQADLTITLGDDCADVESGAIVLLRELKKRLQEDNQDSKLRTIPKEGDVQIEGKM